MPIESVQRIPSTLTQEEQIQRVMTMGLVQDLYKSPKWGLDQVAKCCRKLTAQDKVPEIMRQRIMNMLHKAEDDLVICAEHDPMIDTSIAYVLRDKKRGDVLGFVLWVWATNGDRGRNEDILMVLSPEANVIQKTQRTWSH